MDSRGSAFGYVLNNVAATTARASEVAQIAGRSNPYSIVGRRYRSGAKELRGAGGGGERLAVIFKCPTWSSRDLSKRAHHSGCCALG